MSQRDPQSTAEDDSDQHTEDFEEFGTVVGDRNSLVLHPAGADDGRHFGKAV